MDKWNLLPTNNHKLTKLVAAPKSTAAPNTVTLGPTNPKPTKLATAPECSSISVAAMLAPTMPKLLPQPLDWPYSKLREDPVGYINIYIDDFIKLVQGPKNRCQEVWRTLLNTIDNVFDALLPHKQHYKEPTSVKKLL